MKLEGQLHEIVKLKRSGKIVYHAPAQQAAGLENFCDKPLILSFGRPDTGELCKVDAEIQTMRESGERSRVVFSLERSDTVHFSGLSRSPLDLTVAIDADKQLQRLRTISDDQRRKIFAVLRDIADGVGETLENTRENLTTLFCGEQGREMISLSDCDKELASDFIEWLIDFAFTQGIPLKDSPKEFLEDVERYRALCVKHRICLVCGKPNSDIHHLEGHRIGMGRNRHKIDDSNARKIALCRVHHSELHNMPESEFLQRYHL
ncbi:MAG: putative HNHc nuclease [Bacillota bacterium]|nr:putative HNHc nuclease [Bacillota bacterium]